MLRKYWILALLFVLLAGGIIYLLKRQFFPGSSDGSAPSAEVQVTAFREDEPSRAIAEVSPGGIPDYSGEDVIRLNGGKPGFTAYDLENIQGAHYSELDRLGRCGTAYAMLDRSMMPRAEREEIAEVRPSGWHAARYPDLIEDGFLYNRCHLIAFCLTGENANPLNLITGTRHLNVEGMLPYETEVASFLDDSDKHVLYRVTPLFRGSELVARGVEMEALSVEDRGRSVCFHVFVYNVQPGITIDYMTGVSSMAQEEHTINAWGDSMTQGINGDGVSYPSELEELTGIPVNNFGITGEDSVEIMARSIAYGDQSGDIMILEMGDNGGWDDLDMLIDQYRTMIEEGGTDRYIIISSTDDPDDFKQIWGYTNEAVGLEDTWYEQKLREAFGEHLFISRKYLILNGLRINGLTETEEDRKRAERGCISLQLRKPEIDNTHLNAAGYRAEAYGLYELGKELGYWK